MPSGRHSWQSTWQKTGRESGGWLPLSLLHCLILFLSLHNHFTPHSPCHHLLLVNPAPSTILCITQCNPAPLVHFYPWVHNIWLYLVCNRKRSRRVTVGMDFMTKEEEDLTIIIGWWWQWWWQLWMVNKTSWDRYYGHLQSKWENWTLEASTCLPSKWKN